MSELSEQSELKPELVPCSCGRAAMIEEFFDGDDPQPLFVATCVVCPVKTYDQFTAQEAARIWNAFRAPVVASMNDDSALVEALAAFAHEQWSGWMRYLFERCRYDDDVIIRREDFTRWRRQMRASYLELPENEKESDRQEARRMIEIYTSNVKQQIKH